MNNHWISDRSLYLKLILDLDTDSSILFSSTWLSFICSITSPCSIICLVFPQHFYFLLSLIIDIFQKLCFIILACPPLVKYIFLCSTDVIQILLFCPSQHCTSFLSFLLPTPNFPNILGYLLWMTVSTLCLFSCSSTSFPPLEVFLFTVSSTA